MYDKLDNLTAKGRVIANTVNAVEKSSPVQAEIDLLEKYIIEIRDGIRRLTEKIDPILSPSISQNCQTVAPVEPTANSALTLRLAYLRGVLSTALSDISDTFSRIEL